MLVLELQSIIILSFLLSFDWIDLIVITNSSNVYQHSVPVTATAISHQLLNYYYFIFTKLNSNRNFRKPMQIHKNASSWPFYTIVHPANTKNDKIISLWLHRVYVCYWFFSHIYLFFSRSQFEFRFDFALCSASFSAIECDKPTGTSCSSSEIKTCTTYIDIKLVRDYKA